MPVCGVQWGGDRFGDGWQAEGFCLFAFTHV